MFLGSMNNTDSPTTHVGKVTEMEVTTELEQDFSWLSGHFGT